ncbi:MAG: hypothetical protein AVO38_02765 [delta proteobacterium ML8_D]|nr:MAG: hypothetical protein AVO38_02765 [delta proteobacterium ML8_D]
MAQKNSAYSHLSFSKILKLTFNKVIALVFLSALLLLGFWITYEIRETAKDLELLQMEQGRLNARYKAFTTRVDQIKARSHMEKLGEKMSLHPPADGQIIFLNR